MSVNKIDKIVSKTGDTGTSKDFEGQVFPKSDLLFEVLGDMDELSSFLGLAYHYSQVEFIKEIQKDLQNINSLVATNFDSDLYHILVQMNESDVLKLETKIAEHLDKNPLEPRFYLPGSEKTKTGAYIDYARALTRRVERKLTAFAEQRKRQDLDLAKKYLNRLSDYLFVLTFNL